MSVREDPIVGPSESPDRLGPLRTRKKAPRSRSGCLVCRSRRIRCDEGHPECARCIKYGAECVYPIKKPFDATKIQETLTQRHKPQTPLSTSPQTPKTPLKVYDDAPTSLDGIMALCRMTKMGSFFSNPSVTPPDFLKAAFADQDEMMCFHHCLTYSLSILVIREDNNPWIQHILPIFVVPDGSAPLSTEALRYTFLAIGATHLSYLHTRVRAETEDVHHRTLSQKYRSKTLQLLREARKNPSELTSDAFLATTLLITTNDVFAAEPTWREPWEMCTRTVRFRGGCEKILFGENGSGIPSERHRLLVDHLCMTDNMVVLSSGLSPQIIGLHSNWFERMGKVGSTVEEMRSFEIHRGIHRQLFRYATDACRLIASRITLERRDDMIDYPSFLSRHMFEVEQLTLVLDEWKIEYPALNLDLRTQLGSLVYWHAINIIVKKELSSGRVLDETIQMSAVSILDLCVETGDKIEFLNWPLIIASTVLTDSQLREKARSVIAMFAYQCCKEIEKISQLVEEMWRRMDEGIELGFCGWMGIMVEIGIPVLLG